MRALLLKGTHRASDATSSWDRRETKAQSESQSDDLTCPESHTKRGRAGPEPQAVYSSH